MKPRRCRSAACCGACDGSGTTYDASTNGACWDCRGTGHAHYQPPRRTLRGDLANLRPKFMGWAAGAVTVFWWFAVLIVWVVILAAWFNLYTNH